MQKKINNYCHCLCLTQRNLFTILCRLLGFVVAQFFTWTKKVNFKDYKLQMQTLEKVQFHNENNQRDTTNTQGKAKEHINVQRDMI